MSQGLGVSRMKWHVYHRGNVVSPGFNTERQCVEWINTRPNPPWKELAWMGEEWRDACLILQRGKCQLRSTAPDKGATVNLYRWREGSWWFDVTPMERADSEAQFRAYALRWLAWAAAGERRSV